MPTLLLSFLGSKYTWYAIGFVALVAGFFIYRAHLISEGEAKVKAAVEQATAQEHVRREQVLQWAQDWAAGSVKNVDALNGQLVEANAQISRLSAVNDSRSCLDSGAVERLRALGNGGKSQ
jgi:hypothetical protein